MDQAVLNSLKALIAWHQRNGIAFTDGFALEDWERLQLFVHPYPMLTPQLRATLSNIEPVRDGSVTYWPCQALVSSGEWQDYVYFAQAEKWFPVWGVWPDQDKGKRELAISDVREVSESPSRLPARFAEALYRAGESGMGYTIFEVEFLDGTRVAYGNGNAIDFIAYPPGKSGKDIVAVFPHGGRNAPHPFPPPEYAWCLFSGSAE